MDTGRIEAILEVLLKYTMKDFEDKIPISDRGDELDAIAVGVNTMKPIIIYNTKTKN